MNIPGNMALVAMGSDIEIPDMEFGASKGYIVVDIETDQESKWISVLVLNSKGKMVWVDAGMLTFTLQSLVLQPSTPISPPTGMDGKIIDFSKLRRPS